MRRAVIDIGTNSVKILVGEILAGRQVQPVLERGVQTRLGSGFYSDRVLQPGPVRETAKACAEFVSLARHEGCEATRILATSAARESRNPETLLNAVRDATGLPVEVLSGELEAELVFSGVATSLPQDGRHLVVLDVGGGSTEFIAGSEGRIRYRASFPLGTVRAMEAQTVSDPPTPAEFERCRNSIIKFLSANVQPGLRPVVAEASAPLHWIGTGGTAALLACMELGLGSFDRVQIEAQPLSLETLRQWQSRLWSMSLEARRHLPGLPPNRADVILFGVALFAGILESFSAESLRVSTRGLRFGALLQPS